MRLIEVAREHDLLIICDDVYNTLSYEVDDRLNFLPSPRRLFAYDVKTDSNYKGIMLLNYVFCSISPQLLSSRRSRNTFYSFPYDSTSELLVYRLRH